MPLILGLVRRVLFRSSASARSDDRPAQVANQEAISTDDASLFLDGIRLFESGDHAAALRRFEDLLKRTPDWADLNRHAGLAALALKDADNARDYLTLALHYAPDDHLSTIHLARLLKECGQQDSAWMVLQHFLDRNPKQAAVLFELARFQYDVGEHGKAVGLLCRAIETEPLHAQALNLLGLILAREFGHLEEGRAYVERALEAVPEYSIALSNLGWILAEQGKVAQAMACFDRVLERDPTDSETRLMRAHTQLKNGNWLAGWRDFDARHDSPLAVPRKLDLVELQPDHSVVGQRVFVYAEQGLGDQIMFSSCIPDLLATGASCTIECDKRLEALFRRSFPSATICGQSDATNMGGDTAGRHDCCVAIGSLPGRFRRSPEDFPLHDGYLSADGERAAMWRSRLAELGPGPYIGISWKGGAQKTRRQLRSIPLAQWMPLLDQGAQFISLQYGDCGEDLEEAKKMGLYVHHWPDAIADYDDTAALVLALDLVISVCTAVVHLSGALGRPVWVLTPATPEWRYQSQGESLPWYPKARLFRQGDKESWDSVIRRLAKCLELTGLLSKSG